MEAVVEDSDIDSPKSTFRRRRWYHRRDLRFLSLVAFVLLVFYAYGYATADQKISEDLVAKISQSNSRVNIFVKARFAPEAFHMSIYQKVGNVRGNAKEVTTLHRVLPSDIKMLSRKYWITNISLAPVQKR
jgi:hypothetical protein